MWKRLRAWSDPKEIVLETLVGALNIATSTILSMRSTEAVQTFLRHCDELNERELIGLCEVVSDQSMLGKSNVDGMLLDFLKYCVRTGPTEKRPKLVNVMIPKIRFSDDSALATNKKKGVKPLTDFLTHKNILAVLMDEADIGTVMGCDGQWQHVASQVTRLLATSSLAYTMFSSIDETLSSNPYATDLESLPDDLFESHGGHGSKVPEPSGRQGFQMEERSPCERSARWNSISWG